MVTDVWIDPSEEPSVLRVLLVEDSKHDARAIVRALDRSEPPCEVTHCIRAEDAVEILDAPESVFDVVVSDLQLPGMPGLEFCLNLAREKPDQAIVVLTGHGSERMAVQALKAGMDDYVIKDPEGWYSQMLPVVISQAARQRRERIARKRAEEALQESEEKNRLLVENAPYCIHQIDRQGRLISMNPAGLAMLDASEEKDIIGRAYLDMVSEADKDRIERLLRAALNGEASEFEFRANNDHDFVSS